MSDDVKSKVKKIVADHLGIEEEKVTDEASFIDDLGADEEGETELTEEDLATSPEDEVLDIDAILGASEDEEEEPAVDEAKA